MISVASVLQSNAALTLSKTQTVSVYTHQAAMYCLVYGASQAIETHPSSTRQYASPTSNAATSSNPTFRLL